MEFEWIIWGVVGLMVALAQWLTLTPKQEGDASFQTARLAFTGGQLVKMEVKDAVGQRTEISFTGWKRNPAFAAGTFKYAPAKGVDVVGGP